MMRWRKLYTEPIEYFICERLHGFVTSLEFSKSLYLFAKDGGNGPDGVTTLEPIGNGQCSVALRSPARRPQRTADPD